MLSYDYYPAIMYAIDLISQGQTRTQACDLSNIRIPLFEQYVNAVPEFKDALIEAERRGYDALAEALISIDNHKIHGRSDPKMAKVISENIKWLLEKRKPKDYGQRVTVDHNITADKAIIAALMAGRSRAAAALTHQPGQVIDASFVDVTAESEEDARIMAEILA